MPDKIFSLFILLMFSCHLNPKLNKDEYHVYYSQNIECGEYVYIIDEEYRTVLKWKDEVFNVQNNNDTIFNKFASRTYIKQYLPYCYSKFDTIEMANSTDEVRSGQIGWLYNLRITEKEWSVSLYYPFDDIKGTYFFNITDSEHKIFMSVISTLISDLENRYYPEKDTIKFANYPASALYVKLIEELEYFEYFGSLNSTPCEFNLINQLVIIIIENHVSSHNKKSNLIEHLNIRAKFNSFMRMDRYTGIFIEDHDSVLFKIHPHY